MPTGPTAQLAGTWNVTIDYGRGIGHQQFLLQQSGATLSGNQRGEVFNASLHGSVEADHVTLSSVMRQNGSDVQFNFTGVATGGTLSGAVKMGEYGTASFTATKV